MSYSSGSYVSIANGGGNPSPPAAAASATAPSSAIERAPRLSSDARMSSPGPQQQPGPGASPASAVAPSAAGPFVRARACRRLVGLMPSLLRQLAGNNAAANQREALCKLQKMALCAPGDAPVWQHHFEHCLEAVLRAVQHADEKLRELAMVCTKDLLRSQPTRFKAFTEHVLLRLLAAGRDPARDVAVAAEEALELLLTQSDAHRCMAVLVPVVMKEGPPTLQLAVRLQSKLVPRFTQLQLLAILPQVLPPLFEAFKNPNADVRKAVVFCLVDMYMVLGEQLTPRTPPRTHHHNSHHTRNKKSPCSNTHSPSRHTHTTTERSHTPFFSSLPRRSRGALDLAAQARDDLHQPDRKGARTTGHGLAAVGGRVAAGGAIRVVGGSSAVTVHMVVSFWFGTRRGPL